MKCKDCKHCAYANEEKGQDNPFDFETTGSHGDTYNWSIIRGAYCMLVNITMVDVQECTAYDKRNLKIKP